VNYSLIVPYFKTPEITRLCLYSIFKYSRGEAEVMVVDNAPGGPESAMLCEFPKIRILDNPGAPPGSGGNFDALEVGLAKAAHDLVGFLHSDVILLQDGWDLDCFGRLEKDRLAALGTFEREADPFRPPAKQLLGWWRHLRHERYPGAGASGKLQLHFLLTRRSTLAQAGFEFRRDRHPSVAQLLATGGRVEVLSRVEMGRLLWHTSNVTSLLTGLMDDPKAMARYRERRRRLLGEARIREAFGPVLPRE
jgi:hypothetical protein